MTNAAPAPTCQPQENSYTYLPSERLEAELASFASSLHALTARWLDLLTEFDKRKLWHSWGCRNAAHWLSWHCAVDPTTAREQVRVARALENLPSVREAFQKGQISYSKVRAISRATTGNNEKALLDLALHCTAAQLERLVRQFRRAHDPEELQDDLAARHQARQLKHRELEDGSVVISVRLDPQEAEAVLKAVDQQASRLKAMSRHLGDEMSPEQARADGLVALAEMKISDDRSRLDGVSSRKRSGATRTPDRYQVVVHVDEKALAGDPGGRADDQSGETLSIAAIGRIACDASITTVVHHEGRAPTIGRRSRNVPAWIRRSLAERDKGCLFPGCDSAAYLEAHHVDFWGLGGETCLDNLVQLCWAHHRLLHEDIFSVQAEDVRGETRFTFLHQDGSLIQPLPLPQESSLTHPKELLSKLGVTVCDTACVPDWDGERLNASLVVEGLLGCEPSDPLEPA